MKEVRVEWSARLALILQSHSLVKFGVLSAPVGLHLHSQQGCAAPTQRAAPAEEFGGRNWLIDVLEIAVSVSHLGGTMCQVLQVTLASIVAYFDDANLKLSGYGLLFFKLPFYGELWHFHSWFVWYCWQIISFKFASANLSLVLLQSCCREAHLCRCICQGEGLVCNTFQHRLAFLQTSQRSRKKQAAQVHVLNSWG